MLTDKQTFICTLFSTLHPQNIDQTVKFAENQLLEMQAGLTLMKKNDPEELKNTRKFLLEGAKNLTELLVETRKAIKELEND